MVQTYHLVIMNSPQPTCLIGALPFLGLGGSYLQLMSRSMHRFLAGVSMAIVTSHEQRISIGAKIRNV